ncbi:hypothetical protein CPHLJ_6g3255 [Cryptosporidium parvum]|uniref:Uncharacterized protein n=1 Tax=Cryptosporidium parvum TaxID=5807 RepID=A0A7S7LGF2_CRYPV|nr:Uncharacterized protein CPATCC_0014830 [Cryptosporidium parvum]WKS78440.1 hypothetical protein CPCDC_6g3255 [Cryptosporidium sp. 43IA8]WRK32931.1 Uncharacterized protein cpbgf_6003253 [Cryptosporidium parvum]|eukprot:QOY41211.1 hypothetical protein CPATCC_002880 [Cryptosporidium parvum]
MLSKVLSSIVFCLVSLFCFANAQSVPRDATSIQITLWLSVSLVATLIVFLYFMIKTAPNTGRDPLLNMRIKSEADKSK